MFSLADLKRTAGIAEQRLATAAAAVEENSIVQFHEPLALESIHELFGGLCVVLTTMLLHLYLHSSFYVHWHDLYCAICNAMVFDDDVCVCT